MGLRHFDATPYWRARGSSYLHLDQTSIARRPDWDWKFVHEVELYLPATLSNAMAYSRRLAGTESETVEPRRGRDGTTVTRAILVVLVASVILLGSVTIWQQSTIRHQSDMIANLNFLLAEAHITAVVMAAGTSFTVQSSWDCLATHYSEVFDVVKASTLEGGFNATGDVALYMSTAEQAGDVVQGHPSSSDLTRVGRSMSQVSRWICPRDSTFSGLKGRTPVAAV